MNQFRMMHCVFLSLIRSSSTAAWNILSTAFLQMEPITGTRSSILSKNAGSYQKSRCDQMQRPDPPDRPTVPNAHGSEYNWGDIRNRHKISTMRSDGRLKECFPVKNEYSARQ